MELQWHPDYTVPPRYVISVTLEDGTIETLSIVVQGRSHQLISFTKVRAFEGLIWCLIFSYDSNQVWYPYVYSFNVPVRSVSYVDNSALIVYRRWRVLWS